MALDKEDYDLLIEMRKATRRSHNIANALILSKLVVVLTDKGLYARALSSFLPVYSKLEALLQQHKDVPGLSTVVAVTSTIPARTAAMEQVTSEAAACRCSCALNGAPDVHVLTLTQQQQQQHVKCIRMLLLSDSYQMLHYTRKLHTTHPNCTATCRT
jgi:hypothetical protein